VPPCLRGAGGTGAQQDNRGENDKHAFHVGALSLFYVRAKASQPDDAGIPKLFAVHTASRSCRDFDRSARIGGRARRDLTVRQSGYWG